MSSSETTPVALRVANRLEALARKGVEDVENTLVAISAPPALRVVVLEEMARMAMKAAGRFKERKR